MPAIPHPIRKAIHSHCRNLNVNVVKLCVGAPWCEVCLLCRHLVLSVVLRARTIWHFSIWLDSPGSCMHA